ncbi:MAG: alternative oxidase [Bacteroidales bacterium]|jgi:hypothetical protein|nr:alternative oxidase [Bacteroidales bacterium]
MELQKKDLRAEQMATLSRPRLKYSFAAHFFFFSMDLVTGKRNTLSKAMLLEILASIPYREWEIRKYGKITRSFRNLEKVAYAEGVIDWSRHAQDNEFDHLQVINEKMKEDGLKEAWYLKPIFTTFFVLTYVIIAKLIARINIKGAFHFNGEFEDHAEHVYAGMVNDNPEWENQKVDNPLVKRYADVENWADVFRRIGLDEREHRNESFTLSGNSDLVA